MANTLKTADDIQLCRNT